MPHPLSKAKVAPLFLSCRGGGQTTNFGNTDLNQLSAFFLEKSRDNIQAVKDLIDFNRKVNGWLIFATHDVAANHTPYGCTPQFLKSVVEYAHNSGNQILPVAEALRFMGTPGSDRTWSGPGSKQERIIVGNVPQTRSSEPPPAAINRKSSTTNVRVGDSPLSESRKPLVSILIPAFNSEEWIADTLRSAIAQTWEPKEIIVVDDGSTDRTYAIAKQFESSSVRVVTQKNQGSAASRNAAFSLSKGEYIQWLDADDLLSPNKIASQMAMVEKGITNRTLLSSGFGKFLYRYQQAQFIPTLLWQDMSPTEWLLRKMEKNLYMQTATWLTSRELLEAAGQWNTSLSFDDDGEYYCRVLLVSDGVRFVSESKVYYRSPGTAFGNTVSYVGDSKQKLKAQWESVKLHIKYLRSADDSPRARAACLTFLQDCFGCFYPEMSDTVKEMEQLAAELGGRLAIPQLSWKYAWIKALFGWSVAKSAQGRLLRLKWSLKKTVDKAFSQRGNGIPI
jgi:glycosyltransferase involved in cell wall biosynthesis